MGKAVLISYNGLKRSLGVAQTYLSLQSISALIDQSTFECQRYKGCPAGRGGLTGSGSCDTESVPGAGDFSDNRKSKIENRKSNGNRQSQIQNHKSICLGPIRLTFNERFPCVSVTKSSSQPAALQAGNLAFQSKALKPPHHLPPWAALQAGMLALQSTSGLSPPRSSENLGHSERKMSLRHWQ